jgi:hypothetical protein
MDVPLSNFLKWFRWNLAMFVLNKDYSKNRILFSGSVELMQIYIFYKNALLQNVEKHVKYRCHKYQEYLGMSENLSIKCGRSAA